MSLICPKCQGTKIVLNGKTYYGKQRYKCQNCQRQLVENPRHQPISDAQKQLIDKLLLEKRQRISRLGRKVLSFSKKLSNHL
jgi:transposase-like protein